MRKLIAIIAVFAMLTLVPASGAFADVTSGSDATATVNNYYTTSPQKDITTSNNRGHGFRSFNSPAEMTYPGMPSYFGPATKNFNVQPAKAMTLFKKDFTRAEVESYLHGTSVEHNRAGIGEEATDKITVIFDLPNPDTVTQTALITTSAKNKDTESKDVLYAALLTGLDSGADLLLITAEGAGTILKSFGWGIGLSYTRASINADETTGGVGAGGMGISGGTAGYKSLPWIQAIGLKLK